MTRKPGERLPSNVAELEGVSKAAILLLMVGKDSAGKVLGKLDPEAVQEVSRELASLGRVSRDLQTAVVEEFYNITVASQHVEEGNLEFAKELIKDSLPPELAGRVIQQIQTQVQKTPFAFLQRAESANLLTFIQDEHPQTIALIVSHLPHHKASEILVGLPAQKQVEVVRRVATMEQTNPDVIREVEAGLESRLSNMLQHSMERVGGVET